MVATDFLHDPQVREWLDGVEPAWTLLTFDSLRALRQEPSASLNLLDDLVGERKHVSWHAPRPDPYVRLSRIRLVWGFLCRGCITPLFVVLCCFIV